VETTAVIHRTHLNRVPVSSARIVSVFGQIGSHVAVLPIFVFQHEPRCERKSVIPAYAFYDIYAVWWGLRPSPSVSTVIAGNLSETAARSQPAGLPKMANFTEGGQIKR